MDKQAINKILKRGGTPVMLIMSLEDGAVALHVNGKVSKKTAARLLRKCADDAYVAAQLEGIQ